MQYLTAFLVGGLICAVGQILIDKTGLTPAKILTLFVTAGVLLGALGLYQPLLDFAALSASSRVRSKAPREVSARQWSSV